MNFSKAVKGQTTRSVMLNTIQSKAEVELGHKLSNGDISMMSKRFSNDYISHNIEKVG